MSEQGFVEESRKNYENYFFFRYSTSYLVNRKILINCRIVYGRKRKLEINFRGERNEESIPFNQTDGSNIEVQRILFCGRCCKTVHGDSLRITKDVYPPLARKYKSTPNNIEHDIRTVVNVCWCANKDQMDRIAGYPLSYKPTNSEFVDMLAFYLSSDDR